MIHKYIFAGALVTLALFSGCKEEFLDRPPLDALTSETFLPNGCPGFSLYCTTI